MNGRQSFCPEHLAAEFLWRRALSVEHWASRPLVGCVDRYWAVAGRLRAGRLRWTLLGCRCSAAARSGAAVASGVLGACLRSSEKGEDALLLRSALWPDPGRAQVLDEWRATAVRPQCDRSATAVRPQCDRSATAVRPQCDRSATAARPQPDQRDIARSGRGWHSTAVRSGHRADRRTRASSPSSEDRKSSAPDPRRHCNARARDSRAAAAQ
jgi:hypothetical protein